MLYRIVDVKFFFSWWQKIEVLQEVWFSTSKYFPEAESLVQNFGLDFVYLFFLGNFQPGEEGCILKKYVEREAECLRGLTEDQSLQGFAPTFHGIVNLAEEKYTRMQDLLLPFDNPSLMDCKMGIRFVKLRNLFLPTVLRFLSIAGQLIDQIGLRSTSPAIPGLVGRYPLGTIPRI